MSSAIAIASPVDVAQAAFEDAYAKYKANPDSPPEGAAVPVLKALKPEERRVHIRVWLEERLDAYVDAVRNNPLEANARMMRVSRDQIVKLFKDAGYRVSAASVTRDCKALREAGVAHRDWDGHWMINPPLHLQESLAAYQAAAQKRRDQFESAVIAAWHRLAYLSPYPEGVEPGSAEGRACRERRRLAGFERYSKRPTYAELYRVLRLAFPDEMPEMEVIE